MKTEKSIDRDLSVREVAEALGFSTKWVRDGLIKKGKLEAYQDGDGGDWKIPEIALVRYRAERLARTRKIVEQREENQEGGQ